MIPDGMAAAIDKAQLGSSVAVCVSGVVLKVTI
jgi:hypothetical protein